MLNLVNNDIYFNYSQEKNVAFIKADIKKSNYFQ